MKLENLGNGGLWDNTKKSCVAVGIAAGLCALHHKNLLHRCVSPDNVLLDDNVYPKLNVSIVSRFAPSSGEELTSDVGVPLFMAPEIFDGSGEYTSAVDVYSYGMTLYALAVGNMPFHEQSDNISRFSLLTMIHKGVRPIIPEYVPEAWSDIMKACWEQDWRRRPTMKNIMNEPGKLVWGDDVDMDEFQEYVAMVSVGLDL